MGNAREAGTQRHAGAWAMNDGDGTHERKANMQVGFMQEPCNARGRNKEKQRRLGCCAGPRESGPAAGLAPHGKRVLLGLIWALGVTKETTKNNKKTI